MTFRPHHTFLNEPRLIRIINHLKSAGNVPDALYTSQMVYHSAIIYKLKCALDHLNQLGVKLANPNIEDAISTDSEFMFSINMSIDGFFYSGGSALDILSRELIILYDLRLPRNVYYRHAKIVIGNAHPSSPLLRRLDIPAWMAEYMEYRNVATHELMVGTKYSVEVVQEPGGNIRKLIFPLPDNPRDKPSERTYNNIDDVLDYSKTRFRKLLSHLNTIYGDTVDEINAKGSLPL